MDAHVEAPGIGSSQTTVYWAQGSVTHFKVPFVSLREHTHNGVTNQS